MPKVTTRQDHKLEQLNKKRLHYVLKKTKFKDQNYKKPLTRSRAEFLSEFKIEEESLGLWQAVKRKLLVGKLGMKLEAYDLPDNAKITRSKNDILAFSSSSKRDKYLTEFDLKSSEFQKKEKREELFQYQTQWDSLSEETRKSLETDLKKALGTDENNPSSSLNAMMANPELLRSTINKVVLENNDLNDMQKNNLYLTSDLMALDTLFKMHGSLGIDFKNIPTAGGQGKMVIYIPIYRDDDFQDIAERIFNLKRTMRSDCTPKQASALAMRILKADEIDLNKDIPLRPDAQNTTFPNIPLDNSNSSAGTPSNTPISPSPENARPTITPGK
ncbi:MAG: hypothetical protein OEY79_00575 [Anaplasmataceae bacterium]|nr:hypothetical protein [Anaplasmataceae bacterium]